MTDSQKFEGKGKLGSLRNANSSPNNKLSIKSETKDKEKEKEEEILPNSNLNSSTDIIKDENKIDYLIKLVQKQNAEIRSLESKIKNVENSVFLSSKLLVSLVVVAMNKPIDNTELLNKLMEIETLLTINSSTVSTITTTTIPKKEDNQPDLISLDMV